MNNIPGFQLENIILIIISYILILVINRKTSSESATLLLAILTFHHVVAYLYAFYLNLPQNEVDPAGFVRLANDCLELGYCGYFGQNLYANYLAKMLTIGHSLYFIFLLNVLFFVISLYYFIKIAEFFCLIDNRKAYIFFYGMWPSVVYFTTMHYREPFELYLLIAGVYFGLTGSKSDSFLRMLTSMLLLLLMGMFHIKGLIYLSPILFLILVSSKLPLSILSLGKKIVLLFIMCAGVYVAQLMYIQNFKAVSSSQIEGAEVNRVLEKIDRYADSEIETAEVTTKERIDSNNIAEKRITKHPGSEANLLDKLMKSVTVYRKALFRDGVPGSAFISQISDSSITAFIATYLLVYLEYLFSPFIFQVNSLLGLLAYAESVLRLTLFLSSLVMLKRYPKASILFIIYIFITAMWAIGVVSYGAGIRHHIQTNWILVLLGIPVLSEYIQTKFRFKNDKANTFPAQK